MLFFLATSTMWLWIIAPEILFKCKKLKVQKILVYQACHQVVNVTVLNCRLPGSHCFKVATKTKLWNGYYHSQLPQHQRQNVIELLG